MERKFNYFYKIENKVNGNFYYGVHKTDDLKDGYLGSGKRIKYAIKKYGKENFNKEILLFFDKYVEALNYESEFVSETLILDPSCYNLMKGGFGGWDYCNEHRELNFMSLRMNGYNTGKKYGGNNKLTNEQVKNRLELIKDIDMNKRGWVCKVAKILSISHTQTKRFIDKYYPYSFYRR